VFFFEQRPRRESVGRCRHPGARCRSREDAAKQRIDPYGHRLAALNPSMSETVRAYASADIGTKDQRHACVRPPCRDHVGRRSTTEHMFLARHRPARQGVLRGERAAKTVRDPTLPAGRSRTMLASSPVRQSIACRFGEGHVEVQLGVGAQRHWTAAVINLQGSSGALG